MIPWTAAYQSPPSMGISRQEYWNGLPLPSPYIVTAAAAAAAKSLHSWCQGIDEVIKHKAEVWKIVPVNVKMLIGD